MGSTLETYTNLERLTAFLWFSTIHDNRLKNKCAGVFCITSRYLLAWRVINSRQQESSGVIIQNEETQKKLAWFFINHYAFTERDEIVTMVIT
jgi:hypothetical protein